LRIFTREKLYLQVLLGAAGLIASATITKENAQSSDVKMKTSKLVNTAKEYVSYQCWIKWAGLIKNKTE